LSRGVSSPRATPTECRLGAGNPSAGTPVRVRADFHHPFPARAIHASPEGHFPRTGASLNNEPDLGSGGRKHLPWLFTAPLVSLAGFTHRASREWLGLCVMAVALGTHRSHRHNDHNLRNRLCPGSIARLDHAK